MRCQETNDKLSEGGDGEERKLPTPTKFQVGDRVRVKQGIRDADYPDMPLGGWAGTISEVHDHGMYTVRWSQETLAAIHPVFQKRCERDGMDLEQYWLGDDDLGAGCRWAACHRTSHGDSHQTHYHPKIEDDRVRMVFDLTSNDPLPERGLGDAGDVPQVSCEESASSRSMPEYTSETGPFSSKTIERTSESDWAIPTTSR